MNVDFMQQTDKLEFGALLERVIPNPSAFMVWESPSNSRLPIVIRVVLFCCFPEFIHEKLYFSPGDCNTSDIGHWFAMTGNSLNSIFSHCCIYPISSL